MMFAERRSPSRGGSRPWWSTWPLVLLLGLISLMMVSYTSMLLVLHALLSTPQVDTSGTDFTIPGGLSMGRRILDLILAVVFFVFPIATMWCARKRLLGFLLWAIIANVVVFCVGLAVAGIL